MLEHVRKSEFGQTLDELKRILMPGGRKSHVIDLKDPLGRKLNNLRFSDGWWVKDWVVGSGFYTNRLWFSEMTEMLQDAGWVCLQISVEKFVKIPISRRSLDWAFRNFTDDDLIVSGFHVVLEMPGSPGV